MQCARHPEVTASAFCSNCGTALCAECSQNEGNRVVCAACAPLLTTSMPVSPTAADAGQPDWSPPASTVPEAPPLGYPYCSPGVCFVLGLVPGVGAICNGEYLKAFLQVLLFGSLVSLADSPEVGQFSPLFVILAIALYLYMPLEAYHISKKRTLAQKGIIVQTPFENLQFSEFWTGALAVVLGTIFLVNQYVPGTLRFLLKGWPLLLICIGIYNLFRYFRSRTTA